MFDLFRSRDKMVKIFLSALLLIVALSMLTYLIPSFDTGASTSTARPPLGPSATAPSA